MTKMTFKVKVNDLHFQYQLRVSQAAYSVQIWWLQLKSVTSYRADKQKFTDGRMDACNDNTTLAWKARGIKNHQTFYFYLRPILAFRYCCCLRQSIRHQVCLHDNSSPIQARLTKFGPKMQNTLVKVIIVLGTIDLELQGQIKLLSQN